MLWHNGDMIEAAHIHGANVIVFSANAYVTRDYRLVMGAGAAKRIRDSFPGVDTLLGKQISRRLNDTGRYTQPGVRPDYFFAQVGYAETITIAALQVKRHWEDVADEELTKGGLDLMGSLVRIDPTVTWVMNCPLIGRGGFYNHKARIFSELERRFEHDTNLIICRL